MREDTSPEGRRELLEPEEVDLLPEKRAQVRRERAET